MGRSFEAICRTCGHRFWAHVGGGFGFHLLHCDRCGQDRQISFEEIGEPHLAYLKGLDRPYCAASAEQDEKVRRTYAGEPITREAYHRAVEAKAGRCTCGGRFLFSAPPRCPRCKGADYEEDPKGEVILYD